MTTAAALVTMLLLYAGPRLVVAENGPLPPEADGSSTAAPSAEVGSEPSSDAPPQPAAFALAQADPRPDTEGTDKPGPRFKPAPFAEDAPPLAMPRPAAKPRPPGTPRPPRPMTAPVAESGIEERLDRLERMVESLVTQQNLNRNRNGLPGRGLGQFSVRPDLQELPELRPNMKREAVRSEALPKRAARQSEEAMKMAEKFRQKGVPQEDFEKHLQALHQHRDTLQHEVERLARQIEQMEQEHERINEKKRRQHEEHSEDGESEEGERQ